VGRSRPLIIDLILLTLLSMTLSTPASATNIAWKTAVNGSWHTASNWLPAQVPGPSDVAIISLTGNYTVSINSNASVGAIGLTGGTGTRRVNVNGAVLTTSTGIAVGTTNVLNLNSATVSGAGTIDVSGTLTASGTSAINAVVTHATTDIRVDAAPGSSASLTVGQGFTNNGDITLTPVPNASATLSITNCGQLVNASGGSIASNAVSPSSLTQSYLLAELSNQGALSVNADLTLDCTPGQHASSGSVVINPGRTLHVEGGALTVSGGSVTGNGTLRLTDGAVANFSVFPQLSALLMVNASGTFPGMFTTDNTSIDLEGSTFTGSLTNTAGRTISMRESTIQGLVQNLGTLDIQGTSSLEAFLYNEGMVTIHDGVYLSAGDTGQQNRGVINLLGGTFAVAQTPAGFFTNIGTLTIDPGTAVQVTGGEFRNEVSGILAGAGTYDMSGTTFTNYGTINPGASPGTLTFLGNVTLGSTSVLNMELSGSTPGSGYDQIQVSGNVALNGALNISQVNGYLAQAGDAFDLVTCATHSGQFTTITGTNVGPGKVLAFVPKIRPLDPIRLTTVAQSWTALNAVGIPRRSRHAAAYAGMSNQLIVFGGFGFSGELNDTWVLDNANGTGGLPVWHQLSTGGPSPAARQGHAAAYDATNNRLIVYGGYGPEAPTGFSDVWVLSNANGQGGTPTWTQLTPGGGTPGQRVGGSVGYNPATNRLILFGGVHALDACTYASNDVWILTHANGLGGPPVWSILPTSGLPPYPRSGAVMGYDNASNRLVLHGGADACAYVNLAEARTLTHADGTGGTPTWTTLPLSNPTPGGRSDHAGIYDPMTDRLVTFGGIDASGSEWLGDVFLITNATDAGQAGWCVLDIPPGDVPLPRFDHSLSFDPLTRRMIVFGGDGDEGVRNDTWILNLDIEPGQVSGIPEREPSPGPGPGSGDGNVSNLAVLKAPWPNPTHGRAALAYSLVAAADVSVEVFDVSGRLVRLLYRGMSPEGAHEVMWNGEDDRGPVPSGIYHVVVWSGNEKASRRMVLVR